MTQVKHLYSERANERRRQFNNIINSCDMVLMNNIPEVDPSVWENWEDKSPVSEKCDIEEVDPASNDDGKNYHCGIHDIYTDEEWECEDYEGETEVYQWFAIGSGDAEFLKRHNQYITYSDKLDTYFLAITHFGTGWDYVDSMVEDFSDCYVGLEDFKDEEK